MTWTNGIIPTYARHDAVSLPPAQQTPESHPVTQDAAAPPSISPLNLTQPWKAPVLVPVRAPVALPPATPESARAYTDETLATARSSQQLADKMKKDLGNTKPEDDPTAWTMYNTRSQVAAQDWVTAEQAMAAELRLTYQAAPANKTATQSAATELGARYGDDPAVQLHAGKALNTVLNESALERTSNTTLYDLHRAASKLDGLIASQADGAAVSDQDIATARSDYMAQQKLLLAALEPELGDAIRNLPTVVQMKEVDLDGYAARGMLSRYKDDPEFKAVLQAAVVIKKTAPSEILGPEAQMQKLGELTPASLDPSARRLIMNDPRITPVIDRYVDWAAGSVTASYDNAIDYYKDIDHDPEYQRLMFEGKPPALAASERLVQLTDYNERPYVTPQIAARIINKLRTQQDADGSTTLGKVVDDLALRGEHDKELLGKDNPSGSALSEYPTYNKVISNLSVAVDNAARGSDMKTMQWDSPEIQQAVQGMGGDIAEALPRVRQPAGVGPVEMAPYGSRFDVGFEQAAADGSVTLGLEVARQLRTQPADTYYPGYDGELQADKTLKSVSEGIKQFQENTKTLFDQVNANMAPISSPAARFGPAMTEEQMRAGIKEITGTEDGKKVVATMEQDHNKLDLQGGRLLRVGESVQFYRGDLGDLDGYHAVDRSRTELLDAPESTSTVLLSESATRRIAVQTARSMLDDELEHGFRGPTVYGAAAQFVGDFPEFLVETFVLKGSPNVPLTPDVTAAIDGMRIGHLPVLASGTIWGVGGGFQLAATEYFKDVHFDEKEAWRKPLLMGLVGGFATFHLWEAGFAMARMRPEHFSLIPSISEGLEAKAPWLFYTPGTERDRMTQFTAKPTPGLVASLAGLMSIAVVWDASGVGYRGAEGDWTKVGTHSTNFLMDVALLRLQTSVLTTSLLNGKPAESLLMRSLVHPEKELVWLKNLALRRVPLLAANPFGWIVNIAYAATSVINWGIDQNRYINKLEKFDGLFLKGAGVNKPQADVLNQHGWFSGDGKGDGLAVGYLALNGDPARFVDYVNSLPPKVLDALMGASAVLPKHVEEGQSPALPQSTAYYLTLPVDPAGADVDKTRIVYSEPRDRYEDSTTQMYFQDGKWQYFGAANAGPGAGELRSYDPVSMTVSKDDGSKSWTESLVPQSKLPAAQTDGAFLSLPADPTKIDVSRYTTINYNAKNQRYEDSVTQTYWAQGKWFYDAKIGNSMGYVPPRQDDLVFYDPAQMGLLHRNGFMELMQITSTAGLQNWMFANGVPMPVG